MTAAAPTQPRPFGRVLEGGRLIALFVVGVLFDLLCIANVPGAAVLSPGQDETTQITTSGALVVLLVIACWATVFLRERVPAAVLVAGGLLAVVGVSYVLALVGVYAALLRWPDRTRRIAAITAAAVLLFACREALTDWGRAYSWFFDQDPTDDELRWIIAPFATAVLALAALAGLVAYRRARADATRSRVEAAEQHRRAESLDAELARQAERERIARDLHDGLGHRLSSMSLAAGAFETQAANAELDPALAEWTRVVRNQAHAALEDLRGMVGGLRSDGGAHIPQASLRSVGVLVADLRTAGHRVDAYVLLEGMEHASPAREAAAYRIVQESLTNAIKHAPGMPVALIVDAAPDRGIRLRIENALAEVSAGVPGGQRGIEGIRERASAAGGTVWIGPHGGRFIVDANLPWS